MITHYSPTVTVNSFEYIQNNNTASVMQCKTPLGNACAPFLFSPFSFFLCTCE